MEIAFPKGLIDRGLEEVLVLQGSKETGRYARKDVGGALIFVADSRYDGMRYDVMTKYY